MTRIADQYRIIESAAGWADRSAHGRLRVDGGDARSFLQALVTNDLSALEHGRGIYSAYLTPQGRMITDLRVLHRGDHLLAEVAPGMASRIAARLDQLIFAEDARVSDISASTSVIRVIGGQSPALVARWLGGSDADLVSLPPLWQRDAVPAGDDVGGDPAQDVFAVRADDVEAPAFDVWLPAARRAAVVDWLEGQGAREVPAELVDALRVAAGRPAFGVDMTEETIPLEAGLLDRAISTSKGCYVGQEVIIRVLHRGGGRVAKRLARLVFNPPPDALPEAGAAVLSAGVEVGRLTSVAWSPAGPGAAGLAYLQRDVADAMPPLAIASASGPIDATMVGLAG